MVKNVRDFEMFWSADKECYLTRTTDAIMIEDHRDFLNAELQATKKELVEVKEKLKKQIELRDYWKKVAVNLGCDDDAFITSCVTTAQEKQEERGE